MNVDPASEGASPLAEEGWSLGQCLREYTSTNVVGRGMPLLVHRIVWNPGQFGFDVAIHLRLCAIWGSPPSNRNLQRSIAMQLGIIDQDGVRALLDEADEDDDYKGVKEEERDAVEEVAERIRRRLENRRYLLVLENVPANGWVEDLFAKAGIPLPNADNRCRVVFSSRRQSDDVLARTTSRHYFDVGFAADDEAERNLRKRVTEVASCMEKTMGMVITPGDVRRSLLYWWLFKPVELVPVDDLLSSWVHAELLLPSSSSGGGGGPAREPPPGPLEVGKALLEELCRHYLLKVVWEDSVGSWCRVRSDRLHVKISTRGRMSLRIGSHASDVRQGSWAIPWRGMSLEMEEALIMHPDGRLAEVPPLAHIASAFEIGDWTWKFPARGIDEETELLERLTAFVSADEFGSRPKDIGDVPEDLLSRMARLRHLDLSYTDISSLPDSLFSCHPELRVLLLKHCRRLETLVAPATGVTSSRPGTLHKLRVLDLSNSSVREISDDVLLLHMTNLEELLLSHVASLVRLPTLNMLKNLRIFRMTHTSMEGLLPEELFEHTSQLRILDLSHNPCIKTLPASLSASASTIEEIHLHGCAGLAHVDHTGLLQRMPNLRVFTLSDSPVSHLSFRGCDRLQIIKLSNLEQLVVLDLSGTGIRELPVEVLNLPRLRRLDLLGIRQLRRVPWLAMKRIPQELNLDQCSSSFITVGPTAKEEPPNGRRVTRIFASDPRILNQMYGITKDIALKGSRSSVNFIRDNLQCFRVYISPCNHRVEEKEEGLHHSKVLARHISIPYKMIMAKAKKMV